MKTLLNSFILALILLAGFNSNVQVQAQVSSFVLRTPTQITKVAIPEAQYQTVFNQVTQKGYRLVWIDGYDLNGSVCFNAIFEKNTSNLKWASFHGLTGSQYQSKFNYYVGKGYKLTHIESYRRGNSIRYAPIFTKKSGPAFYAYHGLTSTAYMNKFNSLKNRGYTVKNRSIVKVSGKSYYTVLFVKTSVGSWRAKSGLTASGYQTEFNNNTAAGRRLSYLDVSSSGGVAKFNPVFNQKGSGAWQARHGLTQSQLTTKMSQLKAQGYNMRMIVGYQHGNGLRYAAMWSK